MNSGVFRKPVNGSLLRWKVGNQMLRAKGALKSALNIATLISERSALVYSKRVKLLELSGAHRLETSYLSQLIHRQRYPASLKCFLVLMNPSE